MTDNTDREFSELLRGLVARFGTREALGKKIGMSGSRVGRAVEGQYSFNITNCLKLAEVSGESPGRILRAAGKHEVADLIERLYGKGRPAVGGVERELLEEWEMLSPKSRSALRILVADLLPKKRKPKPAG